MTSKAQKNANTKYRAKLADRGLVRMEVIVPERDRDIVKALAERLAASASAQPDAGDPPTGAAFWAALNSAPSPLDELQLDRSEYQLRAIDL
jgi:hypothetical protein